VREEAVRIFIGSGEQSVVERRVLVHSLRRHTRRPLDIYVFNGTHNAIERNEDPPVPAPLPLRLKYRNLTEFSLYRYLIPEVCGFEGRAIYLDSDMVCLRDIGDFFDQPLDGHDFLAKEEAYEVGTERMWGLSALLIDCSRCRFDLDTIFREIDAGLYTYPEFSQMGRRFLDRHPYQIGRLDPQWNVFDRWDAATKLIHYTDLGRQPWRFRDHPFGGLWFEYFEEARRSGDLRRDELDLATMRGYVRPDLLAGNSSPRSGVLGKIARRLRRSIGRART
jgi:hypothetical protein